ncbi:MenA 1,4-dihydroxy-2-naphthoate octaprenyltransferase [actinobacterium SCGC AAA044-D11]
MNIWIAGARPRTLPAAIAPVLIGTSLINIDNQGINWVNALLALAVGLLLQIAVNYSNDYSDGIRGTDEVRVGPIRLVASGLATADQVKRAAILAYSLAAVSGLVLALKTSPFLVLVGGIAIIAGWNYTGGKNPYGYSGFGEVSVFIFFGLVATMGSYFAQSEKLTWQSLLLAIPMGSLSCTILGLNNLRDRPKDETVGKRTLAVRLGDKKARFALIALLLAALVTSLAAVAITPWALLVLLTLPLYLILINGIMNGVTGLGLIRLLGKAGELQLLTSLLITLALSITKA